MKKTACFTDSLAMKVWCFLLSFCVLGFSACSSDDDDDDSLGRLVSPTVPSAGWSGSAGNGVGTYRPSVEVSDDVFSPYYAFSFEDGVCKEAVLNLVFENETMAKYVCQAFNDGSWSEDSDEDYAIAAEVRNEALWSQAMACAKSVRATLQTQLSTRAASVNALSIACTQDGKVVFFKIECLQGVSGEDVQYVMKAWDTGLNINNLPDRPLFGTWDASSGKYTCQNIYAIANTKYEINLESTANLVTKYSVSLTLPNQGWAELCEEELRDEFDGYQELFGYEPVVERRGNVVSAYVIPAEGVEVPKDEMVKLIFAMDILLNRPIISQML